MSTETVAISRVILETKIFQEIEYLNSKSQSHLCTFVSRMTIPFRINVTRAWITTVIILIV